MKKVIGYLRVSTPDQSEARQRKLIKDYCSLNNYEYLDLKEINDEKKSGAISDREGLARLLRLSNKDADLVMMSETSRLSRQDDLMHLLNSVNTILQAGLDVFFLDSNYTYKGGAFLEPVDLMRLVFEASANAKERKNISLRMKSGKQSKVKQGCFLGNHPPYGYDVVPNPEREKGKEFGSSILQINEEQSKNVKLIFDLIGNRGFTIRGVAKYMNGLNIPKRNVKRNDEFNEKWMFSTIYTIINNKTYTGEYNYMDETCMIPEIEIIDKDLFQLVKTNQTNNHLQLNKGNVNFNLLKSIFKCPCGGNMSLKTSSDSSDTYYRCIKRSGSYYIDNPCKEYGINMKFLNNIVWQITKAFITDKDFELKVQEATKIMGVEIEIKQNQLNELLGQLRVVKTELELSNKNLLRATTDTTFKLFEDNVILKTKEHDNLNKSIERANRELSKLNKQLSNYKLTIDSDLLESLTEQQKNEIYLKYIKTVTYYGITKFKGFVHIIYKDGSDAVIMTESFRNKIAYELPQSFSFNPETRKVIERFEQPNNLDEKLNNSFYIKPTITRESDYKEMFERYDMEEFNMNYEFSKEEIEKINTYDEEHAKLLEEIAE